MKRKTTTNIDPQIFRDVSQVRLAYLFGSAVRKTKKAPADIDIALLLDQNLGAEKILDIRTDLIFKLMKLIGNEVDVVVLNSAGPVLKHQVVKYGKLLYERKKGLSCAFQVNSLRDYEDFLPMQRFYMKVIDEELGI